MKENYSYSDQEYKAGGNGTIVDAIYHKAKSPLDIGNRYIETLPYPLTDIQEIARHYDVGLHTYASSDRKKSRQDRRFLVNQLRVVRVALPFEQDLEMEFYRTLCESYRLRTPCEFFVDGERQCRLQGDVSEAANTGFNMLGFSGCGKSSAVRLLTSRYPQVIRHHINGEISTQIVYLVVSCQPNSNFSALYSSIGRAIDMALRTDVYQKEIDKIRTLAGKMNKIVALIETFGIGTIILDEIQLIDFSNTKESSFEALMVITNETKMAFCVVGTIEAYVKMFKKQRTARRLGREINASYYCQNKKYYQFVLGKLFQYQWFDKPIALTDELVEAFYEETKGIIDQTVSLYIAVQDEYLKTNQKTVTPEFIATVSKRRYPNLKALLERIDEPDIQAQIDKIMCESKKKQEEELNLARQKQMMEQIVDETAEIDISSLIRRTIATIRIVTEKYDESEIENSCKKVAANTSAKDIDEENFCRRVFDFLQTSKIPEPRKKTTKKKGNHDDMLKSIFEDCCDTL